MVMMMKNLIYGRSSQYKAKRYEYLGVTITDNGLFIDHIIIVGGKASKAFYSLMAKNEE